jgi:hypothetical protein
MTTEAVLHTARTTLDSPKRQTRVAESAKFPPDTVTVVPPLEAATEGVRAVTSGRAELRKTPEPPVEKSAPLLATSREYSPSTMAGAGHISELAEIQMQET